MTFGPGWKCSKMIPRRLDFSDFWNPGLKWSKMSPRSLFKPSGTSQACLSQTVRGFHSLGPPGLFKPNCSRFWVLQACLNSTVRGLSSRFVLGPSWSKVKIVWLKTEKGCLNKHAFKQPFSHKRENMFKPHCSNQGFGLGFRWKTYPRL